MADQGLWNLPKVQYSKQTHDLLKDLMKESKLTAFQQKHIERTLKEGGNLPAEIPPTTAKLSHPKVKATVPAQAPKVLNPKVYSGGVRTKETMKAMGAFEKPDHTPLKTCTRSSREKEKLANIMAYGEDKVPVKKQVERIPTPPPTPDRFEELQKEIKERQDFLQEMVSLGNGPKFRTIIATEISQKIREMELIDKKRSKELQKLIEEDSHKNQAGERT